MIDAEVFGRASGISVSSRFRAVSRRLHVVLKEFLLSLSIIFNVIND